MPYLILAFVLAAQPQPVRPKSFVPERLTECLVVDVRGPKPVFVKRLSEVDLSYYGFLLSAYRNPAVADYLLKSKANTMWEYQKGYGVSAEDAAIVIGGLLDYGVDRNFFRDTIDTLRELSMSTSSSHSVRN